MLVRARCVKFESSDFRLFVLPPWFVLLVLWERRIIPVGAHATLQHAPRLADLGLLLSAAVRVEARKKSHCRDQNCSLRISGVSGWERFAQALGGRYRV